MTVEPAPCNNAHCWGRDSCPNAICWCACHGGSPVGPAPTEKLRKLRVDLEREMVEHVFGVGDSIGGSVDYAVELCAEVASKILAGAVEEATRDLHTALLAIHEPVDEEAEVWIDGPGEDLHAERFANCTDCEGHTVTIKVCKECGYTHDGEQPLYRGWPCPTVRALLGETP